MDQPAQEGAGGQNHGAGSDFTGISQPNAGNPAVFDEQIVDFGLDHREIGGLADRPLHGGRIELAVGLGARTAHRRALAAVQNPKLDAALVGDPAHQAVQRIDFPHQMALAESANGRVAGHRADGRKPMRDQRRGRAHARGGGRGLAAGMPATDHDDIEALIHGRGYVGQAAATVKTRRIGGRVRSRVSHETQEFSEPCEESLDSNQKR